MSLFPGLVDNPRCCAYLRKSRKDVERERFGDGDTLSHHRAIISRTAECNGHVISEWLEEVVSGETIAARPMMLELLHGIASGKWDAVYVMEAPRLGRGGGSDQEKIVNAFTLTDTWLITPSGAYSPASERDMRALRYELRSSEDELDWIKARLVQGREQAIREGCWINTATVPYGWKSERVDGKYQLVPHPDEHAVLLSVWGMAESGESLGSIARKLNESGVPTSRGGAKWTGTHVRCLLSNPAHCGLTFYGKERNVRVIDPETLDVVKAVDRSRSNYIEAHGLWWDMCQSGKWGVTEERFRAMQARLSANARTKDGLELKNPLAGILVCAKCGRVMVMKRKKRADGSYNEYYSHNEKRLQSDSCTCRSAPAKIVLELVRDGLIASLEDVEAQVSRLSDDVAAKEAAERAATAAIASAEASITRIMDAYESGVYTLEEFRARKEAAESRIEAATMQSFDIPSAESLEMRSARISECIEAIADDSIPAQVRHDVLAAAVERIEYGNESEKHSRKHNVVLDIFVR